MQKEREQQLHEAWQKALTAMKPHVSQATFQSWLRTAKPLRLTGETFILAVPNKFAREWLEQRYKEVIESSLSEALGAKVQVGFEVEPSQLGLSFNFASEDAAPEGTGNGPPPVTSQRPEPDPEPSAKLEREDAGKPSSSVAIKPSRGSDEGGDFSEFSSIPLNPRYTFDRFVVGRSNSLSHAAAWSVSHHPAEKYNPLFIYGGVGLGKTHLMQAIGHKVKSLLPNIKVAYVSGETFLYHVITAIREDKTAMFRRAYRSVDVWLVDDIQFIASAERTEVEFFHIFNELYDTNRQIVICSDRPPKELNLIEGRLRSRFEWGLITEIGQPDLEHRIAILQKKAQEEGVSLPEDACLYIAQAIQTSIRALEGALTRVIAYSSVVQKPISLDLVKESLHDYAELQPRMVSIRHVLKVVAEHFNVDKEALAGRRRNKGIVFPRHIAMYLARALTQDSFPDIGRAFSVHHSSVMHACEKVSEEIKGDPSLDRLISELKAKIEIEAQGEAAAENL